MDKSHEHDEASRLMLLPAELRLQIYEYLFSSTRLTHPKRRTRRFAKRRKLAPSGLAILRSCRLINAEIGNSWLGQVEFKFKNVKIMLEKLSAVPRAVIEKIRRVFVASDELMIWPDELEDGLDYTLPWALKLLPDLCLDTLTVIGTSKPRVEYDTLNDLVKHGSGWKTLLYLTKNSKMLGFPRSRADTYQRKPQPSAWSDDLIQRDGADSGAYVKIYRSTEPNIRYGVFNLRKAKSFEQKLSPHESLEAFGLKRDAWLMHRTEIWKSLLVIARRGENASLVEDPKMPFHEKDIRQWSGHGTWPEIKEHGHHLYGEYY
ncbi:hypothetical protein BDV06DRAFT_225923 [Aspergillus oleicola]